jgi:pantetheine-phosphate adenylyltransferase
MRAAIYPGSFDPFTRGHLDLVVRALALVDHLYVVVFTHPDKPGWLEPETRVRLIRQALDDVVPSAAVTVDASQDLLVRYMAAHRLTVVVRGLRSARDYVYEEDMSAINRTLLPGVETVYLATRPELAAVSSSRVRELWRYGAPVDFLVPPAVAAGLPTPPRAAADAP